MNGIVHLTSTMLLTPHVQRQLWHLRRGTLITLHNKQEVETLRQAWLASSSPRIQAQKTCFVVPIHRRTWMVAVTPIDQPITSEVVEAARRRLRQAYGTLAEALSYG